jgi:regulatory protein
MAGRPARGRRGEASPGQAERERPGAWGIALKLLAVRSRSSHEVRQTLGRRGYPPDEVAAVIERLTARRYLDDAEFARAWVTARAHRAAVGPARLARELRAKGIPEGQIAAALSALAEEWTASDAAEEAVRRKLKALAGLPPAVARRRLAGYLERRGFPPEIIVRMCRAHLGTTPDAD